MRIFEHPNLDGFTCPICRTAEDKPVTLVGLDGTQHDGIMEAAQIHVDCIDLVLVVGSQEFILYQKGSTLEEVKP